MPYHRLSSVLAFAILFVGSAAAGDHDHDRARAAVEAGETRPLAEILETVRRDYPGGLRVGVTLPGGA